MNQKIITTCGLVLLLASIIYGCNKNKCGLDAVTAPRALLLNVVDHSKQLDLTKPNLFWYEQGVKHYLNDGNMYMPPCNIYYQEWLDTLTNKPVIDSLRPLIKIAGLWQPIDNYSNPSRYYLEYRNHEVDTLDIEFEKRADPNCKSSERYYWTRIKYKGHYLLVDSSFKRPPYHENVYRLVRN